MRSFQWNTAFETHLDEVDRQHHTLVDLVNELGEAFSSDSADEEEIESILKQLFAYTQYHFSEEERLMAREKVDDRHRLAHIGEHARFVEEVTALHAARAHDPNAAVHLLDFLTHWLAFHILGSDQNMARQIHAIDRGTPPDAAFEREEHQSDAATEPLLRALKGLFEQVSARNRELTRLNESLESKVTKRTAELSEANALLESMALTDALTQLPNRRAAMQRFEHLWSSAETQPLCCMMIDADDFKQVNDANGHDAGDLVLQVLARELNQHAAEGDFVARLGGDEFLVLCPATSLLTARQRAETILYAVQQLQVSTGEGAWTGSVSIGVASRTDAMRDFHDLLKQADRGYS
jgi:hemerythrin